MRDYKEVDKKQPRFRVSKYRFNPLNRELFDRFKEANPSLKIDYQTFKNIITEVNLEIVRLVITEREGVFLPKSMGRLYLGLYPPATRKKELVDGKIKQVFHNFDTSSFEGKIMWGWDGVRYKIDNIMFYCFIGHRDFKKRASQGFTETPYLYVRENKYIVKEEYRRKDRNARAQINSQVGDQPSEDTEQSSEFGFALD